MPLPASPSGSSPPRSGRSARHRLLALWPHGPLAIALIAVGGLNIAQGMRLPLTLLPHIRALSGAADSLSGVGSTAQALLGFLMVVAGIGLWRRLSFAWTLGFFLLVIATALAVARVRWGPSVALPAAMLVALWFAKHQFTRRTSASNLVFSISNVLAILAYGAFGSYLLGNGFRPQIHDLSTAFYYEVVTLSTVGYGDIVPVTPEARWFVVSLLILGLSVFASTIVTAVGPKLSHELSRIFNPKEKPVKPKDHVILIGKGAIARNTAKELERRGLAYVQVVAARGEGDEADSRIIEGDATTDTVLRQAGVEQARLVIAAREDDSENAFIVLAVKEVNPNVRILAVASSAVAMRRLKLARADIVFSPAAVGSRLLADLVEGAEIQAEFRDLLEGG